MGQLGLEPGAHMGCCVAGGIPLCHNAGPLISILEYTFLPIWLMDFSFREIHGNRIAVAIVVPIFRDFDKYSGSSQGKKFVPVAYI